MTKYRQIYHSVLDTESKKSSYSKKVVIQPNYHLKKEIYTNEIVSAGYIEERHLKDGNYIEITDSDGE